MLGLGPTELIIILVLALLIFGPRQLPKVAKSVGESVRSFKKVKESTDSIKDNLKKELEEAVLGPPEENKS
ncbi:TPA: twin-arginine translocase TatA/TatE family subunit [Candidatus Micrarchaeota archaeon]|nr:twin-arginine translocase TatA/TatE family subunit [Candidatus Micrarchaeota archaeon]